MRGKKERIYIFFISVFLRLYFNFKRVHDKSRTYMFCNEYEYHNDLS